MEEKVEKRFEKLEKRVSNIETLMSRTSLQRKGKLITCDGCKHPWRTQSKMETVSCPSCGKKVNIKKNIANNKSVESGLNKIL
jgi:rubrerythrin